MTVNTTPIKISTRDKKKEVKEVGPTQENERHWLTLKELEERSIIFMTLMCPTCWKTCSRKKVIELPEYKCPEEMGRVNDPNYYHFHQIVSHPMEKCFILKDLIMKLVNQGRIHLDLNEVVKSNHVIVIFGFLDLVSLHVPPKTLGTCTSTIQCKSPKPQQTQVSCQNTFLHFYQSKGSPNQVLMITNHGKVTNWLEL